jgi:hypothetical protein
MLLAEESGAGKGRHVLSPPQHTETRSAISAPLLGTVFQGVQRIKGYRESGRFVGRACACRRG